MNDSTRVAFAEVDLILSLLEKEYVELIPKELRYTFNSQKDKNYKKVIDVQKPLTEQNLNKETISILALLNYEYWCKSEEEKERLNKIVEETKKENLLIETNKRESFLSKLIKKIKSFFKNS